MKTMTRMMNTSGRPQMSSARSATPTNGPRPTAMSAAAMGRALVLLATSCAAFRGGNPIATRPQSQGKADTVVALMGRDRASALRYRNGDGDQPIEMQLANSDAVTRLVTRKDPNAPRQWPSLSTSSKIDGQQSAMVEYLDYVHKRNRRLNQVALSRTGFVLGFSVLRRMILSPLAIPTPTPVDSAAPPNSARKVSTPEDRRPIAASSSGFVSALRIMAKFFSVNMIPELVDMGGLSVASLAILLVFRPLLKGALSQA
ncbi:hypothetical protein ACHAWF_006263 [Thalassiosira exigua]